MLTTRGANLPLEKITVVYVEQAVAVPFATRQLADLGARIMKVERPGVGDFARGYDETVMGMSSHFVWLNRSKESLALDLKQDEAREILLRLVARADVFVHSALRAVRVWRWRSRLPRDSERARVEAVL